MRSSKRAGRSRATKQANQFRRHVASAAATGAGSAVHTGLEDLEPRLLMSLFGGESFQFTDPRGNVITASLQGNLIATLIGGILDDQGNLMFAEMGGFIRSSVIGRAGGAGTADDNVLGDGVAPVTFDDFFGANTDIFDPIGPGGTFFWPGGADNIDLRALASDADGNTYAFNVFDRGAVANADPAATRFGIQLIQLDPNTGQGVVVARLDDTLSPFNITAMDMNMDMMRDVVGTASSVRAISAAAFNPTNGLLYFSARGNNIDQNNNAFNQVDALYAIDVNSGAITPAQPLNNNQNLGIFGDDAAGTAVAVRALAFDENATGSDLYAFRLINGVGQIIRMNNPNDANTISAAVNVTLDGANVTQISGLAFVNDNPDANEEFIYATVNTGAASEIIRIRLSTGGATHWGGTPDAEDRENPDTANNIPGAPVRGQNLRDMTWNPTFFNPFTNEFGALLATDVSSDELVVIDHRFRLTKESRADIYQVYVSTSDENASISFSGGTRYTGSIGQFAPLNGPVPFDTGVGFLGSLRPSNDAFNQNPILDSDATGNVVTRPGGIDDGNITAGLSVPQTLQSPFVDTDDLDLVDQLLGSNFDRIEGISVSRDGTIVVVDTDGVDDFGDRIFSDEIAVVRFASLDIEADSRELITGTETNRFTDTEFNDGVYHITTAVGSRIDMFYEFQIGSTGIPESVSVSGHLNESDPPGGDTISLQAFNFSTNSWDVLDAAFFTGTTDGFDTFNTAALTEQHVGSGADSGQVRVRFFSSSLEAGTELRIDQIELTFTDPTFGFSLFESEVFDENFNPLRVIQGLDFGDGDFDGVEDLFAIYDKEDGLGPTLGTLDPDTGDFTTIGDLGLGPDARVVGMAFSPGEGSTIGRQGLYAAVDLDRTDSDDSQTLVELDPTTGAVVQQLGVIRDSTPAQASVLAVGTPLNDFTETFFNDESRHVITATGSTIDVYYEFQIGSSTGNETVTVNGFLNETPPAGGDTVSLLAYNWLFDDWDVLDPAILTGSVDGVDSTSSVALPAQYVGFGLDAGLVRVRFLSNSLETASELHLDHVAISEPINVGSMDFDGLGRLVAHDLDTGRLMDVDLTSGVAGASFSTPEGLINSSVGAFSFDPTTEEFYVVDNAMSIQFLSALDEAFSSESALLMTLKDFNSSIEDLSQNLGRFLWDGIVTGEVNVTGSMDLFYGGWIITGESRLISANPLFRGQTIGAPVRDDNFSIGGDLRSLYSLASIGTDAVFDRAPDNPAFSPDYYVGTDVHVAGRLGQIQTLGSFAGHVFTGDDDFIKNLNDGVLAQQEVERYTSAAFTYAGGFLTGLADDSSVFNNNDFESAEYLGSIKASVDGQPDVVRLEGFLQRQLNQPQTDLRDPADYYGISLLAGQTVTVQVRVIGFGTPPNFAIYDPDGRQIATDYNDVDPAAVLNMPIQFTADRPGVYRIAVATPGDADFNGTGGDFGAVPGLTIPYELTVADYGNVALGGLVADGSVFSDSIHPITFEVIPSIIVESGDVGMIEADADGDEVATEGIHLIYSGSTSILVQSGNVRGLQGGSVGYHFTNPYGYGFEPLVAVANGGVGLIRNTIDSNTVTLAATFSTPAGGDIQLLDGTFEVGGLFRTRGGMGVVRAGQMTYGTDFTVFELNTDGLGNDGIFDLIDVEDDFGDINAGGPAIITNLGGNVRFLRVGGDVFQDPLFASGSSSTPLGAITHTPGVSVELRDDSGAQLTITPTEAPNPEFGMTPPEGEPDFPATIAGQLVTLTYGIRGSGGVVLINATSTGGMTISTDSTFEGRPADVTTLTTLAPGLPLIYDPVTNRPIAPTPADDSNEVPVSIIINSTSGGAVDVFDIVGGGLDPVAGTFVGTHFSTISNNSEGGQIVNLVANSVLNLSSRGSIGLNPGVAGAAVNPRSLLSDLGAFAMQFAGSLADIYPFVQQRTAIIAGDFGTITADEGVGNIVAVSVAAPLGPDAPPQTTGQIVSITANSDNDDVLDRFEGINGPIIAGGDLFDAFGDTPGEGNLGMVEIGEGILQNGSGEVGFAGIFAGGSIAGVSGDDYANIRGDIVAVGTVGLVSLDRGSIINADILAVEEFDDAIDYEFFQLVLPDDDTIENPDFEVAGITIRREGGMIGVQVIAPDVGPINIGGFGIINSSFLVAADGVYSGVKADGYGIRGVLFDGGASMGDLSAEGRGDELPITDNSQDLRFGQIFDFDPFFGIMPSTLTDLEIYLATSPAGIITGVIENTAALGSRNLGQVEAFQIRDTSLNYANSTRGIKVLDIVEDLSIVTGSLDKFEAGNDVTDLIMEVAGEIKSIKVTGSVLQTLPGFTLITAKGPNGDIGSVTVTGDFQGDLVIAGTLGKMVVGNSKDPESGDMQGNITVGGTGVPDGKKSVNSIKLFGSLEFGSLDLTGDVGTLEALGTFGRFGDASIIHGNLGSLKVGGDKLVNGSTLGMDLTVEGDVKDITIIGRSQGRIAIDGSLSKYSVTADPATAIDGLPIVSGDVLVRDTLSSATIAGNHVSAKIIGGRNVGKVSISSGDLLGEIVSTLGSISGLTLKDGDLIGRVAAPHGSISSLSTTHDVTGTAIIEALNGGKLSVAGTMRTGAMVRIDDELSSLSVGGHIEANATVWTGSAGSVSAGGSLLGHLDLGWNAKGTTINVGGNYSGLTEVDGDARISVGGNIGGDVGVPALESSILVGGNATAAVKGAFAGDLLAGRNILGFSATDVLGSVITAGFDINSFKATGAVSNSLVQAGRSRGDDGQFGTNDLAEAARLGDIKGIEVGTVIDSIFAAGGDIVSLGSSGELTNATVSTGLVLDGAAIDAVLNDLTPLSSAIEQDAARTNATLLNGSFGNVALGGAGLAASVLAAGVSPGADGRYGTGDDNVVSSITGGRSSFSGKVNAISGGGSLLLADAGAAGQLVGYGIADLTPTNPLPGQVAAVGAGTQQVDFGAEALIITLNGPGQVQVHDNPATTNIVEAIVITGTDASTSLIVTSTNPDTLAIGRVLMADDARLKDFIYNGDILGDNSPDVDLWLDSDLATLTMRNMANDAQWRGQVGGKVGTFTIGGQGPGRLVVGGGISTLNLAGSIGDPAGDLLGSGVGGPLTGAIVDLATNSAGTTFVFDAGNLVAVDPDTGTTGAFTPVTASGAGVSINLTDIDFNAADVLFGAATIYNQAPTVSLGTLPAGFTLRSLAVSSTGRVVGVDSSTGFDRLVQFDPATALISVIGEVRDVFTNSFTNHISSLVFRNSGANETLFAVVSDRDGNAGTFTPADGAALAKIESTDANGDGVVRLSNYSSLGSAQPAVPIDGDGLAGAPFAAVTDALTALAVRRSDGAVFAIRRSGGADELVQLNLAGNGISAIAVLTSVGFISVDGLTTNIVGLGFDEADRLVAYDNNGAAAQQIVVNAANPADSSLLTAAGALNPAIDAFAIGYSGPNFQAFAYDGAAGGMLYTNPGLSPTLGTIDTATGVFTQLRGLAEDAAGNPLTGDLRGMTVSKASGEVFAIAADGRLLHYAANGSLIANLGQVIDEASGQPLSIAGIQDNGQGNLIGLDAGFNRVVVIDPATGMASPITEPGLVPVNTLSGVDLDPTGDRLLSYSLAADRFVESLFTSSQSIGGLIADDINAVNITGGTFTGRVASGGTTGIGGVKYTGAGDFLGSIVSDSGVKSFAQTGGGDFGGAVVAELELGSFSLTGGDVQTSGFIVAGSAKGIKISDSKGAGGHFAGSVLADTLGSMSISEDVDPTGIIDVEFDAGSITTGGIFDGMADLGALTGTFRVDGLFDGDVTVWSDAGTVNLAGGADTDSTFIVERGIKSVKVGEVASGLIAAGRGAGSAGFADLLGAVIAFGMDSGSVSVSGNATNTLLSFGTWVGDDHIYNSADDVLTGGSPKSVSIRGNLFDSVLAAGVLPRPGVAAQPGTAGIPNDRRAFVGNSAATLIEDVDAVEAGGVLPSAFTKLTISGTVTNSSPITGRRSFLVAADGIDEKVNVSNLLQQVVLDDETGAPVVIAVNRVSGTEIEVIFSELINSASFLASADNNGDGDLDDPGDVVGNITVRDLDGNIISGLTLKYSTQVGFDGSAQGVLSVGRPVGFGLEPVDLIVSGNESVPTIYDRSGLRSALRDFNQDGQAQLGEDPFGSILDGNDDGFEGGEFLALVYAQDPEDDFEDAAAIEIPLTINVPRNVVGLSFEDAADVDVFYFTGAAGQYFSVDHEGTAPTVMAVFVRDDQGNLDPDDDTFELLSRYESNDDLFTFGNDDLFMAFELPVTGDYFVVVAPPPEDPGPSIGATYSLRMVLSNSAEDLAAANNAVLEDDGGLFLRTRHLDDIAYFNNLDNPPKQLLYLNFTGGIADGFEDEFDTLVPMAALDAGVLDPLLEGLTQSLIFGDDALGTAGIIDIVSEVYARVLGSQNVHLVTSSVDLVTYDLAADGLWIVVDPALVAQLDPAEPYTEILIGQGDGELLGGGFFGIANNIDLANLSKDDQAIILANEFANLSDSLTVPNLLVDYAMAIGNTVAHEFGHVLGLVHTVLNTDPDDPNSVGGEIELMTNGDGTGVELLDLNVLGTTPLTDPFGLSGGEFPIGWQDSFELVTRWLL